MVGILAPTLNPTGGGFTQPTNETSVAAEALSQGMKAAADVTDFMSKEWIRSAAGGNKDKQWILEQRDLQGFASQMDIANELRANGQEARADLVQKDAYNNFITKWGMTDAFDDVSLLKTGMPAKMASVSLKDQAMIAMFDDPRFMQISLPAARARLEAKGIPSTEENLRDEAFKIYQKSRNDEFIIEDVTNENKAAWLEGGEQSFINQMTNLFDSFQGAYLEGRKQGIGQGAEALQLAEIKWRQERAKFETKIPAGVNRDGWNAAMTAQENVFKFLKSADSDFIDNLSDATWATIIKGAKDPTMQVILAGMAKQPTLLQSLNIDKVVTYLADLPATLPASDVFAPDSPVWTENAKPSTDGQGESMIPPMDTSMGIPTVPQMNLNLLGIGQLFPKLDVSTPEGAAAAFDLVDKMNALGTLQGAPRFAPQQLKSTITPAFLNQLEKLRKVDEPRYFQVRNGIKEMLASSRQIWDKKAGGVANEAPFLIDPKTQEIKVDTAKFKKEMASYWQQLAPELDKFYNGDITAAFKDKGARLSGNVQDTFRVRTGQMQSEYNQIKSWQDSIKWANSTIQSLGGTIDQDSKGNDILPGQVVNQAQESVPKKWDPVNMTEEWWNQQPEGTEVIGPDGQTYRKN